MVSAETVTFAFPAFTSEFSTNAFTELFTTPVITAPPTATEPEPEIAPVLPTIDKSSFADTVTPLPSAFAEFD